MIDVFNDIDGFESDLITIDDIYDVIYGSLVSYYKNDNLNLIKKTNNILLKEKKSIDEDCLICKINIENEKIVKINYDNQTKLVDLSYNIKNDKFKVFLGFRSSFDEYLKNRE